MTTVMYCIGSLRLAVPVVVIVSSLFPVLFTLLLCVRASAFEEYEMKKHYLLAVALLFLMPQPGYASELEIPTVVVTASRTAETIENTLASVTVITREEIQKQQARSVADVLQGLAGMSISNNGGLGKTTSVFLRGTGSGHLLVLIDGVKAGSATVGTTAFEHIPVEQIERIEIVRGPLSSLYGSEAIGGVLQIFTKKGGGESKPFFSVGAGSDNIYSASLGFSAGGERGWYNLSVSGINSKGFNACRGKPFPDGAGCFTLEPDDDGYSHYSGSLRAGYQFDNGLEFDAHALRAVGDTEFDGGFQNEADSVLQVFGGSVQFRPVENWHLNLLAGRSQDESENLKDGVFSSHFDTQRDTLSMLSMFSIRRTNSSSDSLMLGLDYQKDEVDSTTDYVVSSRNNKAIFAQYMADFDRQNLQLSIRRDDNEQFGEKNTGNVAWAYTVSSTLRVKASYGTAFKAPTFNELYFPGFGNDALHPEQSKSVEFALSGNINQSSWSTGIFQTEIDELIAFDASTFAPANIDQARIRGFEAILHSSVKRWDLSTNVTILDPENRSNGINSGNVLPRRAKQAMRFDASYQMGKHTLGTTLFAQGKRYDDLANSRELAGYATIDLRAEYVLMNDWLVQARIENLLDKTYETAAFFNQPERGFFVTLRYQP